MMFSTGASAPLLLCSAQRRHEFPHIRVLCFPPVQVHLFCCALSCAVLSKEQSRIAVANHGQYSGLNQSEKRSGKQSSRKAIAAP
jgi:hypothetical protein